MPDTKREQVLSVRDLDITFKTTAGPVHAIRGVNIDLYKGETVALVGESGSGKSVTMKAAMGILAQNAKVNSGSIRFSYHHADGSPDHGRRKADEELPAPAVRRYASARGHRHRAVLRPGPAHLR